MPTVMMIALGIGVLVPLLGLGLLTAALVIWCVYNETTF